MNFHVALVRKKNILKVKYFVVFYHCTLLIKKCDKKKNAVVKKFKKYFCERSNDIINSFRNWNYHGKL